MKTLFDPVRTRLAEILVPALEGTMDVRQVFDLLVEPPNSEMGDLAFGVFQLAKVLKKGPPVIAKEVVAKLAADPLVAKVEAAGPYVNFKLNAAAVGPLILDGMRDGSYFKTTLLEKTPKTMIEFCQPNTHKELHVGHMRNACLGDSLVRLMRYAGYSVVSSTFPGDVGTHVAKCLWYLKFHNTEPEPATQKGEWLGRMYSKGNLKLEDELGTPNEAKNREQLTEILKQLEAKSGEFYDLWLKTRQWSIELMEQVYDWAGVEFDQWYWESEMDSPSVKYVKELYAEGKVVLSEGAIGMDLNEDKLGFCLLLKSDGTGLYATKDIELARRKFQDYHIEKNLYVVDMRQALHFQQVFKTLEKLGFEQAKDCYHLQYNYVELPDGAMSSRKGNIVPLMKLVNGMEDMIKTKYLARFAGEWTADETNTIASEVAQGAIKYGMVKMDPNKKIVFDMDEWLQLDGDSGPFIQYSAARIQSILRKVGQAEGRVDWSLLTHPAEHRVLQQLLHFHHIVILAAENYKPSLLATYLFELAKKYNAFYHDCPIGTAETPALKNTRLALCESVLAVLKQGLQLIGIPTPNKM